MSSSPPPNAVDKLSMVMLSKGYLSVKSKLYQGYTHFLMLCQLTLWIGGIVILVRNRNATHDCDHVWAFCIASCANSGSLFLTLCEQKRHVNKYKDLLPLHRAQNYAKAFSNAFYAIIYFYAFAMAVLSVVILIYVYPNECGTYFSDNFYELWIYFLVVALAQIAYIVLSMFVDFMICCCKIGNPPEEEYRAAQYQSNASLEHADMNANFYTGSV